MAEEGMRFNLMDVDKFVRINGLKPVTNPLMLERNAPSADGVLSYEIFGTSPQERRQRFAYIDLHQHYMHPLAATKLKAYDRTLSKCLYSQAKYTLTSNGELVEDNESGDSGPEFLYRIWDKIQVKDKDTIITKELETFFKQKRDKLFLTKFPVIPAFYRDLNTSGDARDMKKSSSEINNVYNSIISQVETLNMYSDTFSGMTRLTQSRIQSLLVDIYDRLMVKKVKGQPSKFGMIRHNMQGKNVNYSARLVISSPILQRSSYEDVQVKFGSVVLPLAYTISCFFPFVVYHLKRYFDNEFIQGGKYPVYDNETQKVTYTTFTTSYDENQITSMITHYLNNPADRFNPMMTPPDIKGNRYRMMIDGRFHKSDTTETRPATVTDIMYIVTCEAVKDKHVFITRYPLDNYNGQFPARITVATTIDTEPALIGDDYYQFYPICKGDPANSFIDTLEFSNTMLGPLGGDWINEHNKCHLIMVPAA